MKENQNIEWKQSWRDEYLKWICGFANADGGELLIGRNDKGVTVGVKDAGKLMVEVPNKVRDILGIMVDVNLRQEDGTELVEIRVEPYPSPVNYKGEYFYRSGTWGSSAVLPEHQSGSDALQAAVTGRTPVETSVETPVKMSDRIIEPERAEASDMLVVFRYLIAAWALAETPLSGTLPKKSRTLPKKSGTLPRIGYKPASSPKGAVFRVEGWVKTPKDGLGEPRGRLQDVLAETQETTGDGLGARLDEKLGETQAAIVRTVSDRRRPDHIGGGRQNFGRNFGESFGENHLALGAEPRFDPGSGGFRQEGGHWEVLR